MTCCPKESKLLDLKSARQKLSEGDVNSDLKHTYRVMREFLIEHYDLNKIPTHLVDYLSLYKERIDIAEQTLIIFINKLIDDIENETPKGACS